MGIYAMNRTVLEMIPYNKPFGFDDLLLMMLTNNQPVTVYLYAGYWLDIGRPDDNDEANEDIQMLDSLL